MPTKKQVTSKPKPVIPLEKDIQKDIIKYLKSLKVGTVLRHNTGSFKTGNRFIKCGETGTADLSLELDDSTVTIWIECKRPGRKPTQEQLDFISRQQKRGNIAFVATCVEDVRQKLLKNYLIIV